MHLAISNAWQRLVTTHDAHVIDFASQLIIHLVFWWLPCTLFAALDVLAPSLSARHKMQPAPKQPSWFQVRDAIGRCVCDQAMVSALHGALSYEGFLHHRPPAVRFDARLPGLAELARDVALCAAGREVLFYYAHRAFHGRFLYQRFHKVHHRFTAPVAWASEYAHPVEHLVANVLPVAAPPVLMRTHAVSMWVFVALQLVETATVHSGYDFLGGLARKHDRHHERFNVYFGGIGVLDWCHGTDERDGLQSRGRRKTE